MKRVYDVQTPLFSLFRRRPRPLSILFSNTFHAPKAPSCFFLGQVPYSYYSLIINCLRHTIFGKPAFCRHLYAHIVIVRRPPYALLTAVERWVWRPSATLPTAVEQQGIRLSYMPCTALCNHIPAGIGEPYRHYSPSPIPSGLPPFPARHTEQGFVYSRILSGRLLNPRNIC